MQQAIEQSTPALYGSVAFAFSPRAHRTLEDIDVERRRRLRLFLMGCRGRLAPSDLGLPRTKRRRVQGLRRDEVAELVGVSVGWYRSFESGRAIRVSPQFVARLASVLRLTAAEQRFIFRLAILELYVIGDPH